METDDYIVKWKCPNCRSEQSEEELRDKIKKCPICKADLDEIRIFG